MVDNMQSMLISVNHSMTEAFTEAKNLVVESFTNTRYFISITFKECKLFLNGVLAVWVSTEDTNNLKRETKPESSLPYDKGRGKGPDSNARKKMPLEADITMRDTRDTKNINSVLNKAQTLLKQDITKTDIRDTNNINSVPNRAPSE